MELHIFVFASPQRCPAKLLHFHAENKIISSRSRESAFFVREFVSDGLTRGARNSPLHRVSFLPPNNCPLHENLESHRALPAFGRSRASDYLTRRAPRTLRSPILLLPHRIYRFECTSLCVNRWHTSFYIDILRQVLARNMI